ncbi:MAG TPA: amidohydrolase family protein [Polyangia bacterium]
MDRSRRDFLRLSVTSAVGAPLLAACGGATAGSPDGGAGDAGLCPGHDPAAAPARTIFQGYSELADLPEFDLDCNGRLRCTIPDLRAFDVHTHLGFRWLRAPAIDLQAATESVHYYIDCDGAEPPCTIDLTRYANECATPAMLQQMDDDILSAFSTEGSPVTSTHTIPNLLAEMDAAGIERAVVLPIAMGLDTGDTQTEDWLDAIAAAGAAARLVPFGSVHPADPEKLTKLRAYQERGIKGLKLHPSNQRIFPDDPATMELYAECERLGLPVLLHSGRAGIEPPSVQPFNDIAHFVAPAKDYPNVQFVLAHAGARLDWQAALALAEEAPNVWLDLAGPGLGPLRAILAALGPERLLFATDWPFYPEAYALAKTLIVTREDAHARDLILRENAQRLLFGG